MRINSRKIRLPKIGIKSRLILYVVTIVFGVVSLVEVAYNLFPEVINYIIFTLSGAGIFTSAWYIYYDIMHSIEKFTKIVVESNSLARRIYRDHRYRMMVSTTISFLINILYALGNGLYGIINNSMWFITLAIYYMVLSIMKVNVLWYERKVSILEITKELKLKEIYVYRRCGILLTFMTLVLGGAVELMVKNEGGKEYKGYLIFIVAAYTFYNMIMSIINLIKVRKFKSIIIKTIKNIGYAEAMVSMLSLQTAMFVSFKSESKINENYINGLTGTVVCSIVLAIGIYMVYSSNKLIYKVREE